MREKAYRSKVKIHSRPALGVRQPARFRSTTHTAGEPDPHWRIPRLAVAHHLNSSASVDSTDWMCSYLGYCDYPRPRRQSQVAGGMETGEVQPVWLSDPPELELDRCVGGPAAAGRRPRRFFSATRGRPGQAQEGPRRPPEGRFATQLAGIDSGNGQGAQLLDGRHKVVLRVWVLAGPRRYNGLIIDSSAASNTPAAPAPAAAHRPSPREGTWLKIPTAFL